MLKIFRKIVFEGRNLPEFGLFYLSGKVCMLCEKCQKRPAAVHMTKIVSGAKTETNLCEVCAQEENAMAFGFQPNWILQNIFAELFNQPLAEKQSLNVAGANPVHCNQCGFSDTQFSQAGKLGCPKCYDVFESKLEPVLRGIHGNPKHTGKIPKRSGEALGLMKEVEALKLVLQQAVSHEEYERAAEIRDKIRSHENKLG